MLIGALIAALLILGLFLEMISSWPKVNPKRHSDTEV